MNLRLGIRWLALTVLLLLHLQLRAATVVFINPGKSDEIYWLTASNAMKAAASSLGFQLEVIYAERNHDKIYEIAREVSVRAPSVRPDFVICTNDYDVAPAALRLLDTAHIKTFLAFSGIHTRDDRSLTGLPRQNYKNWLGSLEPHAEDAGYLTAKALIEQGRRKAPKSADGKIHMLAISGDRSTPVSLQRTDGLLRAVAETRDVVLDQNVYGQWERSQAEEKSNWLFERYPGAHLIWAGSDQMAFGSMKAWESRGGVAGKDAWFSGINTSAEAMQAIESCRLTALAGGHFMSGAWSLVILYDYMHGKDFADSERLEMDNAMFSLFSPKEARIYMERFGDMNFDKVDFRRFTKTLNPRIRKYDFQFRQLLQ